MKNANAAQTKIRQPIPNVAMPPAIIAMNRAALERAQRLLALCDRRIAQLEKDLDASNLQQVRDLMALARTIHALEKDTEKYARIVYPIPFEAVHGLEAESLADQVGRILEKVSENDVSGLPFVGGHAQTREGKKSKFSESFFQPRSQQK